MIRILFSIFLACMSVIPLYAQEKVKALCFHTINGIVYVNLKNEVTCSFENADEMCLSVDGKNKLKLKFSDISYHYVKEVDVDKTTNIPTLLSKKELYVTHINEGFFISGLSEGEIVKVMTTDGKVFAKIIADIYGSVVINTSNYPKGIYIIAMSLHRSLKIQKI